MFYRFCGRVLLFFVAFTLALCGFSTLPAPEREVSFISALADKHDRLREQRSPKVVLIGGSNVAFGIDSKQLRDVLRKPVVNVGLNADFGLKYMLQDVRPYLNGGDILAVMPEYELFWKPTGGGTALAVLLSEFDPQGWQYLSLMERVAIGEYLVPYLCRKAMYQVEVLGNRALGRNVINSGLKVYNRDSLNEFGDVDAHWSLAGGQVEPYPSNPTAEIDHEILRFFKRYRDDLAKKGIRMILLPPVLQRSSFENREAMIHKLVAEMEACGLVFEQSPETNRFDDDLFFDTPYHLNRQGIDQRMPLLEDAFE